MNRKDIATRLMNYISNARIELEKYASYNKNIRALLEEFDKCSVDMQNKCP
jgi:hypothetical protein